MNTTKPYKYTGFPVIQTSHMFKLYVSLVFLVNITNNLAIYLYIYVHSFIIFEFLILTFKDLETSGALKMLNKKILSTLISFL